MTSWGNIDIKYGSKPKDVSPSKLDISPNGLIIKRITPQETLKIPSNFLISAKSAKDDPSVSDPSRLFFISLDYYQNAENKAAAKKSTCLIQTFNTPGYDLSIAGAHTDSPAAKLKARLVEQMKAIIEAASKSPPPSSQTAPQPVDMKKEVGTTATDNKQNLQNQKSPTQSTLAPSLTPLTLSTQDIITQFIPEVPPSPTTASLRISCLQSNPHLSTVFDQFVNRDKIMTISEFWSLHEKFFNEFRAETEQAPIPTSYDVINQMAEFNYSFVDNTQKGKDKSGNDKYRSTQAVKSRAKDVSTQLQRLNLMETKRVLIENKNATAMISINDQLKNVTAQSSIPKASQSSPIGGSNDGNSLMTIKEDIKGQISDKQLSVQEQQQQKLLLLATLPMRPELRNNIHTQQLTGDEFGWGHGAYDRNDRAAIFDPKVAQSLDVESKEKFWLVNNVIKGLNILGQTEVDINKGKIEQEKGEFFESFDDYQKAKKVLFKDEMTIQLEPRSHGNPSGLLSSGGIQGELNTSQILIGDVKNIKGEQHDLRKESISRVKNENNTKLTPSMNNIEIKPGLKIGDLLSNLNQHSINTTNSNTEQQKTQTIKTEPDTTTPSSNPPLTNLANNIPPPLESLSLYDTKYSKSSNVTLICKSKHPYTQNLPNTANSTDKNALLQSLSQSNPLALFDASDDGLVFQYKVHQLETKMLTMVTNYAQQNNPVKVSDKYTWGVNDGVIYGQDGNRDGKNSGDYLEYYASGNSMIIGKDKIEQNNDDIDMWDIPIQQPIKRQRRIAINWLDDEDGTQNDNNIPLLQQQQHSHIPLNDIQPVSALLSNSIPNNNTVFGILSSSATALVPHHSSNNTNPGNTSNKPTSLTNTQSTVSQDASVIMAQRKLMAGQKNNNIDVIVPVEIFQTIDVVKELASIYWSTANKTIKPRPGAPYQALFQALYKQLTVIKDKMVNLSRSHIEGLKSVYSKQQQSHLVSLLSTVDYIIDAALQHYNAIPI